MGLGGCRHERFKRHLARTQMKVPQEGQGSDQEAEVPPYGRFNRTRCRGGALGRHRFGSTLEKSTKELGIGPGATGFIEALQVCFRGQGILGGPRHGFARPGAGQTLLQE